MKIAMRILGFLLASALLIAPVVDSFAIGPGPDPGPDRRGPGPDPGPDPGPGPR